MKPIEMHPPYKTANSFGQRALGFAPETKVLDVLAWITSAKIALGQLADQVDGIPALEASPNLTLAELSDVDRAAFTISGPPTDAEVSEHDVLTPENTPGLD
jgi:hypothetical protein